MASAEFDRQSKLVSSYLFTSLQLAGIRFLIAPYTLVVLLFQVIWEATKTDDGDIYFSYFTNLSLVGICAYFFASGVQTICYALNLRKEKEGYPLQQWPRFLRYLHVLLLATVVTFPILVTIVYWALLTSASTFKTPYSGNYSPLLVHALNTVFALFEIALTNIGPLTWIDLPVTIVLLGGYLGVAYITYATQGIYTYSFLDPKKQGSLLAAYIVGIAVGQVVIYLVVLGLIHLRERLVSRKGKKVLPAGVERNGYQKPETP